MAKHQQQDRTLDEASEHKKKHTVRVHIDQEPYESPNPTTGIALYKLGQIQPGLALYREVRGDHEDPEVPQTDDLVHLKMDDHFHSGKPKPIHIEIFVNGRLKVVDSREVSFERIVMLAFDPVPTGPNILFTVTYRDGPPANPRGHMIDGQTLQVKDRMKFDVTATDKS